MSTLPTDACTGCGACENVCRLDALSLLPDGRGFARPEIDKEKCVDCGQCVQACPICTPPDGAPLSEAKVYSLRSRDEELRFHSTSGGAFSELALTILRRGGCVVGAAYREDWSVEHRMIEREEELEPLRRSKYQQSDTGLVFRRVKEKLEEGREVLFCGTPCQAAGLRSFLGRDEEKLYLCDFICRGITSPLIFREYLRDLERRYQSKAVSVWQKNKRKGWRSLSTVVAFENGQEYEGTGAEDPAVQLLLRHDLGVRPSCYDCRFKGDHDAADITLGDFWGLDDPKLDDNLGTSVVICRTEKGRALADAAILNCVVSEETVETVARGNPCLLSPLPRKDRLDDAFFQILQKSGFQAAYQSVCGTGGGGTVKRHIVLFGCGKFASDFYHTYKDQFVIDYALSNNPAEHIFSPEIGTGFEVRRPAVKKGKGPLIVICAAAYEEIAEQLTLLGYTPFEDFTDYEMMELSMGGKKPALLYGVCHLRGVCDCLRHSADFMARYEPFYYASYLPRSAYQQMRLGYLAEMCELFVYSLAVMPQEARKNAALLGRLKNDTKRYCLPVAYFGGYFPQRERTWNDMNRYAVQCTGYDYTPFSYGDCWLNQCIDRGMRLEGVLESLHGETAYDRDFVLRYLDREWRQLELQERQSDFKILDYVKENFQKRRLFRNEAHMENEVLEYYARQLLRKLGLEDGLPHVTERLMRCSQHLIYPGVADILGLEWDVEREPLELYTYAGWRTVTPREYVEYYLETCKKTKELKELHMLP